MKKILGYGLLVVVVLLFAFYYLFPETVFKLATDSQRRSAGLVKKEVQVDDHKIIYLEGGKGETIVLLHGFGGDKDNWTAFARYLKGYHLVIPDVAGFGESSQVSTDIYDQESQVKRIDRFVEVLKLDKIHMAGNSMGGAWTAVYGSRYPQKILTLALLAPAGAPSPKKSELLIQLEKGNNPMVGSNVEDFRKLMAMVFVKPPKVPESFEKIMAADWVAHRAFNEKIFNDYLKACMPIQCALTPYLPLIQARVLILWGDQDKLLDVGGVAFLEKNLKNYQTVIMKDTGHCPMAEKPEETANVYLSFLRDKR